MANTEQLNTDVFRILVVDDDEGALDDVKRCFGDMEGLDFTLIDDPDKIDNLQAAEETYHMVVSDMMFDEKNKIQFSLARIKQVWPDAIIVVSSYYPQGLPDGDQNAADVFLNKLKLTVDPSILCNRLIELIPSPSIRSNPNAEKFLQRLKKSKLPKDDYNCMIRTCDKLRVLLLNNNNNVREEIQRSDRNG